jgi:hypothetical protein
MAQFMLSVHSVEGGDRPQITEEDMRQSAAELATLNADLASSGALVFAARLHEPAAAKVVRGNKGRLRVTDGPFIEAKEQVGGFYIIEAPDLDAALEWASRTSEVIRSPIEVRPLVDTQLS